MATHFWLFPWIALAAGLAALALGAWGRPATPPAALGPLPRPLVVLWIVLTAGATLGGLRLGTMAGVDVIAARGVLAGALGGLLLVLAARQPGDAGRPARLLGLGTALVAAGSLWLSHGEFSGLASVAFGAALSLLCLGVAPSLLTPTVPAEEEAASASVVGLLFVVTLEAATTLGYLRADTLAARYWGDIPLLLAAALAVGAALGAALGQGRRWAATATTLAVGLLVCLPLVRLAHAPLLAGLVALGALLLGLLGPLSTRPSVSQPEEADPTRLLGPLLASVMVLGGCTLAFSLWSGYGLALFALGGWFAGGPALLGKDSRARAAQAAGFSFAALLLIYRLALLQNSPAVRASGPGDTWDLFAIGLGALLPLAAAEWTRLSGLASRLPPWAVVLQWLLALALPALVLDYIWQPRSVTGVLLGAALGQLSAGLAPEAGRRQAAVALSAVILALVLFEFLPALQQVSPPTRHLRVAIILGGGLLLALRLLVSRQSVPRAAV